MPIIRLSGQAEQQLSALAVHYLSKNYVEAHRKLIRAVTYAADPAHFATHYFLPAPRPAPELAVLQLSWMIHEGYWFAYNQTKPPVIVAIIHGSADISRHGRGLRF